MPKSECRVLPGSSVGPAIFGQQNLIPAGARRPLTIANRNSIFMPYPHHPARPRTLRSFPAQMVVVPGTTGRRVTPRAKSTPLLISSFFSFRRKGFLLPKV